MKAETKKSGGKTITVTQIGSSYGKGPEMKETMIGLGLRHQRQSSELVDTPAVRGMINKVRHLVSVKEGK